MKGMNDEPVISLHIKRIRTTITKTFTANSKIRIEHLH